MVATRPLPRGTVTWVMDSLDRTFPAASFARLKAPVHTLAERYCYRNRKGEYVLCWDHARFINHSFKPNCVATAYNFELAVRDIAAGEELTDDYGFLNIIAPFRACDEGGQQRVVYPDDIKRHYRRWDRMLSGAFRRFSSVEQPLHPYMPPHIWRKAMRIAAGTETMDSILNNLFTDTDPTPGNTK